MLRNSEYSKLTLICLAKSFLNEFKKIVLGMSKQEDFHRPKMPLEKTREIDNEARISKEAEI